MRLRVHHPLVAGFLGVIGTFVVLVVLLIGSGLRRELDRLYEDDLTRQLNLAEALVEASPLESPDRLARLITERLGNRVTLIDLQGVVLGDSFVEPERLREVENHIGRPEVQGVLGGEETSFEQRASATVAQSLLYGARLTSLNDQPVILRIAAPRTEIEAAVDRIQRTVAATGLLTMVLALVAVFFLSMAFTRPLVALVDRAGRLAQGDFSTKVPSSRVAELQDLGFAFNRLTEELQARLSELGRERDEMQTLIDCMAEGVIALTEDARLMRTNRAARAMLGVVDLPSFAPVGSVIRDQELRGALERSVSQEAQSGELTIGGRNVLLASRALDQGGAVTTLLDITELRRLEQVRRDFVANASHELKTPLTAIRGFAETLVEDDPPAYLRKQFLESIRQNTLRLQRLVDDLLDLSRLESGGWSAAKEEVPLAEVVQEAWELVSPGREVGRDLTVKGDATALGDREGLVNVFRNLFENAVRHTEEGGHVHVDVEHGARPGLLRISVSDDGEGIPARSLPRIFERFYRADSSRARDFGGTGLGLAIVKHLVSSMGGEIRAESELGRGTTIRFTIPRAPG
jgi:two-component system, OmpR family, phosphate regulon sensor histidine kinase PhoR